MDADAAVPADLELLSRALDEAGGDIAAKLLRVVTDARAAVASYRGVTVSVGAAAFTVTVMADNAYPGSVASSISLPFSAPGGDRGVPVATVTLYAARPGAFVDLAADLVWLTGLDAATYALDLHVPPPGGPAGPGVVSPLHVASTIDQAVGVLIGQGHSPEAAVRVLDARATAADTDRYAAAASVLDALPGAVAN